MRSAPTLFCLASSCFLSILSTLQRMSPLKHANQVHLETPSTSPHSSSPLASCPPSPSLARAQVSAIWHSKTKGLQHWQPRLPSLSVVVRLQTVHGFMLPLALMPSSPRIKINQISFANAFARTPGTPPFGSGPPSSSRHKMKPPALEIPILQEHIHHN